jgi:hypothetical protein
LQTVILVFEIGHCSPKRAGDDEAETPKSSKRSKPEDGADGSEACQTLCPPLQGVPYKIGVLENPLSTEIFGH